MSASIRFNQSIIKVHFIVNKKNLNVYAGNILFKQSLRNDTKQAIISFVDRKAANNFTYLLQTSNLSIMPEILFENNNDNIFKLNESIYIPEFFPELDDMNFDDYFVHEMDIYNFQRTMTTHNHNVLLCENEHDSLFNFNAEFYTSLNNPYDYVNILNRLVK